MTTQDRPMAAKPPGNRVMRVLGIDPGTATTGYGVIERTGSRLRHVAHGVITTPAGQPLPERLMTIYSECLRLIELHRPDVVGIEKIYVARNVTTAVSVIEARGVITLAMAQHHLPLGEFSALSVKSAVVGYGKADKRQVQEMVKRLLGLEAIPRPDDAADALAVAICCAHAGVG